MCTVVIQLRKHDECADPEQLCALWYKQTQSHITEDNKVIGTVHANTECKAGAQHTCIFLLPSHPE